MHIYKNYSNPYKNTYTDEDFTYMGMVVDGKEIIDVWSPRHYPEYFIPRIDNKYFMSHEERVLFNTLRNKKLQSSRTFEEYYCT